MKIFKLPLEFFIKKGFDPNAFRNGELLKY